MVLSSCGCEVAPAGLPILEGTDTHRNWTRPSTQALLEKLMSVWWLSRGRDFSPHWGGGGWEVDGIAQPRRSLVSWDHKGRKRGQAGAGGQVGRGAEEQRPAGPGRPRRW